ncbi:MAG: ORF6N domain-containing protein [Carboxydocellales bacterium]
MSKLKPVSVVGKAIREFRKVKGMKQYALAQKAGISRSYMADVEGGRCNPSLSTLERIAKALGTTAAKLLQAKPGSGEMALTKKIPVTTQPVAPVAKEHVLEIVPPVVELIEVPRQQSELVRIQGKDLPVKEYEGERVVTFQDIDQLHKRPTGTAKRNFNRHKAKLITGIDYIPVQGYEFRTFGIDSNAGGYLITESGYLMLVKSFQDELAWRVQRQLVSSYFRAKQLTLANVQQLIQTQIQGQRQEILLELRQELQEDQQEMKWQAKAMNERAQFMDKSNRDLMDTITIYQSQLDFVEERMMNHRIDGRLVKIVDQIMVARLKEVCGARWMEVHYLREMKQDIKQKYKLEDYKDIRIAEWEVTTKYIETWVPSDQRQKEKSRPTDRSD